MDNPNLSNLNPDAPPYHPLVYVQLFDPFSPNLNPDAPPYYPRGYFPAYLRLFDPVTQHSVFYSLIPPNHPTTSSLRAVSEAEAPPLDEAPPSAGVPPPAEAEVESQYKAEVEAELPTPAMAMVESQRQYEADVEAELSTPTPTILLDSQAEVEAELPTPAKVGRQRPYKSIRLLSKTLRLGNKTVYIDLEKNNYGEYFHLKDPSGKIGENYILLDRSGVVEFHGHINFFFERYTQHWETDKRIEDLYEKRTMTHNKKEYTFTTALLEGRPILRIRMIEGCHNNSIAIPAEHGFAGWFEFGKKLLDVLVEHDATTVDEKPMRSS